MHELCLEQATPTEGPQQAADSLLQFGVAGGGLGIRASAHEYRPSSNRNHVQRADKFAFPADTRDAVKRAVNVRLYEPFPVRQTIEGLLHLTFSDVARVVARDRPVCDVDPTAEWLYDRGESDRNRCITITVHDLFGRRCIQPRHLGEP